MIDRTSRVAPKTGARCSCKRGVRRDNCPTCEGTGHVIDFAALRAASCVRHGHAYSVTHDNGRCLRCGRQR